MPDIPLEIKLAIVDDLKYASAHPKQDHCSGIVLAWPGVLFRIRKYRFSVIQIQTTEKLRSLLDMFEGAPSICALVQKVYVDPSTPRRDFYEDPELRRLFKLLIGVTAMAFRTIRPFSAPGTASAFQCLPASITDVELNILPEHNSPPAGAASKIFALLRVFPSMEHLTLRCVFEHGMADAIEEPAAEAFPSLRSMDLPADALEAPIVVRHLTRRGLFPNIESLTLGDGFLDRFTVAALNKLLQCWSSTLCELQLPFSTLAAPGLSLTLHFSLCLY